MRRFDIVADRGFAMGASGGLVEEWKSRVGGEFAKPYMRELRSFLRNELAAKKEVYPQGSEYFAALNKTPYSNVKVVILGQDPYHGPGQAHGLSFSVRPGVRPPPSLVNIYKELEADLGIPPPSHGYLDHWASQGVLLLNSVLTVEAHKAASHKGIGWETFTDCIIYELSLSASPIAFLLWGSYAQKKGSFLDESKHLVLKSPHPSPLSAHRGFFGSRPFSKINRFLQEQGRTPISWRLPELH